MAADRVQLIQLFQNLIGNAIKFHGSKAPLVHIGAVQQGGEWVFSVHDNGIGIDAACNERIFQVFQRLHTRAEYPGTGIGESELGNGATFFFNLPTAAPE